nr:ribonuclease H-like domain-containing protein [Tanacetum cinerariifolium]
MFTDSECIVLRKDFKLKDDTNVLLRTPRQHNMYSIDINNIVPHKNLACLVAKALVDEKNKLIEKGAGPNWLFDIDTLTNLMIYVPVVVAGTSSTNISGIVMHQMAVMLMFLKAVGSQIPLATLKVPSATSKVPSADQVEPIVSLTVESKIPTVNSPIPTVCLDISPKSSSGPRLITKGDFS